MLSKIEMEKGIAMNNKEIIQIMPCNHKVYSTFKNEDGSTIKSPVLGFAIVKEEGLTLIETFSAWKDWLEVDSKSSNFTGYEYDIEGYSNSEEYMGNNTSKALEEKLISIVMKYANKHKNSWGISEAVAQDDRAMVDAVDLFGEIIGTLTPQKERDE